MFATIASWFIFGSVMYWAVTVLIVILLFVAIEKESSFLAGMEIILYIVFLQWLAKVDILGTIQDKPVTFLLSLLGYVAIGIGWSFVKWWLMIRKKVGEYIKARIDFLKDRGLDDVDTHTEVPQNLRSEWDRRAPFGSKKAPKASENKGKLTGWIIYWPISLIWSLIDDIIKEMIEQIVIALQRVYQVISDKAYSGINKDFGK